MLLQKRLLAKYSLPHLKVYLVNATYVRRQFFTGFTMGGHDLVYSDFVPSKEVWIADELDTYERKMTIYHELFERRWMAKGLFYDEAHNLANVAEGKARHGGDLDNLINIEMDKIKDDMSEASHFNGHIHNGVNDRNNQVHHVHKNKRRNARRLSYEDSGISLTR